MSRKLLKSTAIVSSMTMVSRIMGFLRDMVLARYFGADAGTDAFFVAFKIPNFMRRLFAEGAFSQAFVPVLSEYKTRREHEEVRELVNHVTGSLGVILIGITVVGVILAPIFIMIFAPGFIGDANKFDLASTMLRITFPYLLFISLTALAGGILNTYGHFGIPAFTPVLLNISLIGAAIFLAPYMEKPVVALAWGVLIAGIAQLLFQIPYLIRIHMLPMPSLNRAHEGVVRIMKLMLPSIFGSSVAQINLLVDTLIASFLASGSVSWLYYSDRLVEFPLGVFGIALATVILPSLSNRHAEHDPHQFSRTLDWAMRWVLIIGVPSTIALFMMAAPMIITLFQYGEFDRDAVDKTTLSLMAYSLGLLGFIMVKVLAPGFFARQDTRTPVRIGVIAMVSNMVLNMLFVVPMTIYGYDAPHAGLALATSCAAIINASLLFHTLQKNGLYKPESGWIRLFIQVAAASAMMVISLSWWMADHSEWMTWDMKFRAWNLVLLIMLGAITYTSALILFGARPWRWKMPRGE